MRPEKPGLALKQPAGVIHPDSSFVRSAPLATQAKGGSSADIADRVMAIGTRLGVRADTSRAARSLHAGFAITPGPLGGNDLYASPFQYVGLLASVVPVSKHRDMFAINQGKLASKSSEDRTGGDLSSDGW